MHSVGLCPLVVDDCGDLRPIRTILVPAVRVSSISCRRRRYIMLPLGNISCDRKSHIIAPTAPPLRPLTLNNACHLFPYLSPIFAPTPAKSAMFAHTRSPPSEREMARAARRKESAQLWTSTSKKRKNRSFPQTPSRHFLRKRHPPSRREAQCLYRTELPHNKYPPVKRGVFQFRA